MHERKPVSSRIGFDPQASPERAAHRLYAHVVWATRGHDVLSSPAARGAVESHLITLCRRLDVEALAVAALDDRVHVLLRLKPTHSLGSLVRRLKDGTGGASAEGELSVTWAHGYAAITVGSRDVRRVMRFLARLGDACDAASDSAAPGRRRTRWDRARPLTTPAAGR